MTMTCFIAKAKNLCIKKVQLVFFMIEYGSSIDFSVVCCALLKSFITPLKCKSRNHNCASYQQVSEAGAIILMGAPQCNLSSFLVQSLSGHHVFKQTDCNMVLVLLQPFEVDGCCIFLPSNKTCKLEQACIYGTGSVWEIKGYFPPSPELFNMPV